LQKTQSYFKKIGLNKITNLKSGTFLFFIFLIPIYSTLHFMKNTLIIFLCTCLNTVAAQSNINTGTSYAIRAQNLISSFNDDTVKLLHFPFDDSLRQKWERVPGLRRGLKLSMFTENQKILFHELMRSCLTTQGYLTVTSIMFNEDIQQKFEPTLGRNEFWVEIFGEPSSNKFWSWKLEGHHLSLNFTFYGNKMISNSPFLMATNPSNAITDSSRAGLIILYKEEEMARSFLNSLSGEQLKLAYSSHKKPDSVYSEQYKERINVPDEGIYFYTLSKAQQQLLKQLVGEYFNNFNEGEIMSVDEFCNKKLRFFYMDGREKGKPHYYRLENGKQIIEYENYGNHIHCFWRTSNDFGKEQTK
jgi:hypothetical protein